MTRRQVDPLIAALRERRETLGMSQQDVAEQTGTDNDAVSRRECGHASPALAVLRAWADALDCDIALVPRSDLQVTDEAAGVTRLHPGRGRRAGGEVDELVGRAAQFDRLGLPAWQIAERLGVSRRSVVRYLKRRRQGVAA